MPVCFWHGHIFIYHLLPFGRYGLGDTPKITPVYRGPECQRLTKFVMVIDTDLVKARCSSSNYTSGAFPRGQSRKASRYFDVLTCDISSVTFGP